MLRYLTIAVLLAGAAPALAQPCKVTRKDGGLESFASAIIVDATAKSMLYGQGPRLFDLTIEPDAKANGYTFKDNGKVGFHIYRTGRSLDGKDWMQPGSIGTELAAFEVDWPRLFLKADMVKSVGVHLKMEGMAERDVITNFKEGQARDGFERPLDYYGFDGPRDLYWFSEAYDDEEEDEIATAWLNAIVPGKPMTVDFYDTTDKNFLDKKIAKQKIATATLTFPTDEMFQPRYVADITALRKAFTDKRCDAPK